MPSDAAGTKTWPLSHLCLEIKLGIVCGVIGIPEMLQKPQMFDQDFGQGIIPVRKMEFRRRLPDNLGKLEVVDMVDGWEEVVHHVRVEAPCEPVDHMTLGGEIDRGFRLMCTPIPVNFSRNVR